MILIIPYCYASVRIYVLINNQRQNAPLREIIFKSERGRYSAKKTQSWLELICAIWYWLLIWTHIYCNACYLGSQIWSLAKRPQAINQNEIKTEKPNAQAPSTISGRVTNLKWLLIDDMHEIAGFYEHMPLALIWQRHRENDWMCGRVAYTLHNQDHWNIAPIHCAWLSTQSVYRESLLSNDVLLLACLCLSVNLSFDAYYAKMTFDWLYSHFLQNTQMWYLSSHLLYKT